MYSDVGKTSNIVATVGELDDRNESPYQKNVSKDQVHC